MAAFVLFNETRIEPLEIYNLFIDMGALLAPRLRSSESKWCFCSRDGRFLPGQRARDTMKMFYLILLAVLSSFESCLLVRTVAFPQ